MYLPTTRRPIVLLSEDNILVVTLQTLERMLIDICVGFGGTL